MAYAGSVGTGFAKVVSSSSAAIAVFVAAVLVVVLVVAEGFLRWCAGVKCSDGSPDRPPARSPDRPTE